MPLSALMCPYGYTYRTPSRDGALQLVWAIFVGIIYAIIGLKGEGCYYLIGNNMLDNCCLMNIDICMLIY